MSTPARRLRFMKTRRNQISWKHGRWPRSSRGSVGGLKTGKTHSQLFVPKPPAIKPTLPPLPSINMEGDLGAGCFIFFFSFRVWACHCLARLWVPSGLIMKWRTGVEPSLSMSPLFSAFSRMAATIVWLCPRSAVAIHKVITAINTSCLEPSAAAWHIPSCWVEEGRCHRRVTVPPWPQER